MFSDKVKYRSFPLSRDMLNSEAAAAESKSVLLQYSRKPKFFFPEYYSKRNA